MRLLCRRTLWGWGRVQQSEQALRPVTGGGLVTATSPPLPRHTPSPALIGPCVCPGIKKGRVRQPDPTRPDWTGSQREAPGPGQHGFGLRLRFGRFDRPLPAGLFINVRGIGLDQSENRFSIASSHPREGLDSELCYSNIKKYIKIRTNIRQPLLFEPVMGRPRGRDVGEPHAVYS